MGQVLHGSATTTAAVRRAIQHSQESLRALASRYGVNQTTIETAIDRYKHLIGTKLRARTLGGQQREAAIAVAALNRRITTAKPISVRRD